LTVAWRLRAAAAALLLPAAIRTMSLARLMTWITPPHPAEPAAPSALDDRELARWVTRILAHLPGLWHLSCLNRSVVLYHLLRTAGRPVELCIGAKRVGGVALAAHAWLILDGAPYLESESRLVTRLPVVARFPDALARST
jgi:hypothetical protein